MKKVLSLILVALLVVTCFAGCNQKSEENVIVIGATGPLTGDASSYGISVRNGAMLAVEEINAAGGFNGIKLKFVMKDDKATAEDATAGYNSLMDEGMQIALGSVTSGSCKAFAAQSVEDNLFFMTPSASEAAVIEGRNNAFRVCFGDPDQGTLAVKELKAKGYQNIGAIYDISDSYSSGIYAAFKAEMEAQGMTFQTQTFDKDNNKDFSTQVEALKACDVIFLPIYYTEAGLIAKTCASKGCTAALFGCDGLDGVADKIDSTVTNKITYITPFAVNSQDAVPKKFVEAYKAKYNTLPDQFAADGYDAVYALYQAMKAAGIKDAKIEASELCEAVKKAITAEGFKLDGATGVMTWDASGACTKVPQIVAVN